MHYRLLYSGFDKLDVAFQGALPRKALELIRAAKEKADEQQAPVLETIGPGAVKMLVADHGMRGGYAFVCDTGPTGAHWFFKDDTDTSKYGVFASVHSTALMCQSLPKIITELREALDNMGAIVGQESINRVDYAMDFLAPGFELRPELFVAHPRAKQRPYWSDKEEDDARPSAVIAGRRYESMTIGKMPGRQVIVYDKRREALDRGKLHWFKVWNLDPASSENEIWRIEVRTGKSCLKKTWNIRTFADLDASIGDAFLDALDQVRYIAPGQTDSNVSRQLNHPIWNEARSVITEFLFEHRSGLTPGQIREIVKEEAIETYLQQIVGNAAGLGVVLGFSDTEIRDRLPGHISKLLETRFRKSDDRIWKSVLRAQDRLHFVTESQ